jgi:hypothetical protein
MAQLLNTLPVIDLVVEDPPIEAVIDQIYQEGAAVLKAPTGESPPLTPLDYRPAGASEEETR